MGEIWLDCFACSKQSVVSEDDPKCALTLSTYYAPDSVLNVEICTCLRHRSSSEEAICLSEFRQKWI